jgi:hypothetical protein
MSGLIGSVPTGNFAEPRLTSGAFASLRTIARRSACETQTGPKPPKFCPVGAGLYFCALKVRRRASCAAFCEIIFLRCPCQL